VVICGWHRTGTTSLHVALQRLGYQVHGFDRALALEQMYGKLGHIWRAAARAEAFRDFPWSLLYREFDQRYPGSRFILTVRDAEGWIASYKRHDDNHRGAEYHRWLYGLSTPDGNEQAFIRTYLAHNAAVQQHFHERPEQLLTVNVFEGSGWDELCGFLDKPVPTSPFPNEKSAVL